MRSLHESSARVAATRDSRARTRAVGLQMCETYCRYRLAVGHHNSSGPALGNDPIPHDQIPIDASRRAVGDRNVRLARFGVERGDPHRHDAKADDNETHRR